MIEYNPEDVKDDNDFTPFPVGMYECEIIEANQMVSKQGNDMIRLNVLITNDTGGTMRIYDYIVIPKTLYKLKSICRCLNMEFDGTLNEQDLVDQRLKVKVGIDKGNDKYPPKNRIDKYVEGIGSHSTPVKTPAIPIDDVPF